MILGIFTPAYLPEDARLGELVASLSQMNAGVTTTVDTSQVSLTPEHTDACIAGLKESGRRALFAYSRWPGDQEPISAGHRPAAKAIFFFRRSVADAGAGR